ncbi:MAG: hypothetical protein AB1758_36910, partial [Candidatus Eremiobacterota bacterium]
NRLGDHFAGWLEHSPEPRGAQAAPLKKRAFLVDLARLELAICQVFDEAETPVLTSEQVAAVPWETWERARLLPIAALRLLRFDYPVHGYLKAVLSEGEPPPLRKKENFVVVWRQRYSVWRMPLTGPQYRLLDSLRAGTPLAEALGQFPRLRPGTVFQWFQDWVSEGFFQSVES